MGAVLVDADERGGPPGLIFGPDGLAAAALGTAVAAADDDDLPTTTAFSQHSFIYNLRTSPDSTVSQCPGTASYSECYIPGSRGYN